MPQENFATGFRCTVHSRHKPDTTLTVQSYHTQYTLKIYTTNSQCSRLFIYNTAASGKCANDQIAAAATRAAVLLAAYSTGGLNSQLNKQQVIRKD